MLCEDTTLRYIAMHNIFGFSGFNQTAIVLRRYSTHIKPRKTINHYGFAVFD